MYFEFISNFHTYYSRVINVIKQNSKPLKPGLMLKNSVD